MRRRRSGPEYIAEQSCQFRQRARSRLVQRDTQRTRQIAAGNGGIPDHSIDGSFSIKSDLLPIRQEDSSQLLSRTAEKHHSEAAQRNGNRNPDLTGRDAGRHSEICGSYRAISSQVSAFRPLFLRLRCFQPLVSVRSYSLSRSGLAA